MLKKYLEKLVAAKLLRAPQISQALQSLPGWEFADGKLKKKFEFQTFEDANFFISRYSNQCLKLNHTAQWSNVYNRVEVAIDASVEEPDCVSVKDVQLARYLERIGSVDLSVTSLLDYYQHPSIALDVKPWLNDQDQPTTGRSHTPLLYENRQQKLLEGTSASDKSVSPSLPIESEEHYDIHNAGYDFYESLGLERVNKLRQRDFGKDEFYDSEEYLSDPEEATVGKPAGLKIEGTI